MFLRKTEETVQVQKERAPLNLLEGKEIEVPHKAFFRKS